MEEGPEYKIPHFYVDYDLVKELFKDFEIINIYQVIDYYEEKEKLFDSYHYHVLIRPKWLWGENEIWINKSEEKDKNVIYNLMQLYTYELRFFEDETATFTILDSGLYVMNKLWKDIGKMKIDIHIY